MKRINQLLIFPLCFFLVHCSTVKDVKDTAIDTVDGIIPLDLSGKRKAVYGTKDYAEALVAKINPSWFDTQDRFALDLGDGDDVPHRFFDVAPELNPQRLSLNFVVETPEGSDSLFGIDISSGQLYTKKLLCEQSDANKRHKGVIFKPPFTVGLVPRILDQLGTPQKIIVFGDREYYQKNFRENFFDVRVVGGFIQRVCPYGACRKFDEMNSRVVIVAVQAGSERFEQVRRIEDLRLLVNWREVEAFIENGFGKNFVAGSYYAAYRVGPELSALQTFNSLKSKSIFLTASKLSQMRSSCHKLYDHIWEKVGGLSDTENRLQRSSNRKEQQKILKDTAKIKTRFFYQRFIPMFRKYVKEYNTCVKYVYPSNIHFDPDRHWFFAFYSAVNLLNDLGYSFDCSRSIYVKNTLLASGRKSIPVEREFRNCSARQVDMAFETAIDFLDNLRRKNYPSYRYIDYDRHSIGTHNKIYSWVYQENKKLQCVGSQKDLVLKN